tara:strand:+ start:3826 stop:4965 length:1140 start_codon:yes stop_codon:yes gene_type:complete
MISILKKCVDYVLTQATLWRARFSAVLQERRRWRRREDGPQPLRVFYGHPHVPRRDEPASGGIVKCQDLETIFPNAPHGASLMYLVSSALPSAPGVMNHYARKAGVRLVWNQNGVAIPAYHGTRCEVINAPRRRLFLDAEHVVYQSAFCEQTSRRYLGERKGPAEILYNPVDTTVFTPRNHTLNADTAVLLMAGSHCHGYRVFSAITCLAEMTRRDLPVRLVIAGRFVWGASEEACLRETRNLCRTLGVQDQVELRGAYLQTDAEAVMRAGDILLHTKYMDPCPRLVVEAMACGLPVIYSDSGGVPELVGDEAGVAVSVPQDWDTIHEIQPDKTADAVEKVLATYPAFSEAARRRAETRFDVKPWLNRHRAIFEAVHAD